LYFFQKKGGALFNKQVDETLSQCFPNYAEFGFFEIGVPEKYITKKAIVKPINLSRLNGKEVLFPKLKLRSKLDRDTPEIMYGKLLHECLALLDVAENAERTIERVTAGNIDAAMYRNRLLQDLKKVMDMPQSQSWFNASHHIFREQELVATNGETLRPDRVVVTAEKVVVIDYKSGTENKKHKEQVSRYKDELSRLYQLPVEGYLLYTEGPSICAV
jgi:ATP-dependent exoDNAse (exonuclease V) beta subunit